MDDISKQVHEDNDAHTALHGPRRALERLRAIFVLFCFVWLATLGLPVVASRTAARTFRRVVKAP